ncbi:MAG: hypothetical protein HC877_04950 [Thioploca sp.]|nr:hypothetical protein [Thioploca sp.]
MPGEFYTHTQHRGGILPTLPGLQLAIQALQEQELWTSATLPGFPQEIHAEQLQRHSWKTYENIRLKPASRENH